LLSLNNNVYLKRKVAKLKTTAGEQTHNTAKVAC